ncbi:hypothetical protein FOZ63_011981, partial [Perkinsus olseni]
PKDLRDWHRRVAIVLLQDADGTFQCRAGVERKPGFKEWKGHMRRHRAYLTVIESYLARDLRLLRLRHREEARVDPMATVSLLSDDHLPDLVATEGARKASGELREQLCWAPEPPVSLPPITRRSVGSPRLPLRADTELAHDAIAGSTFDSLVAASFDIQLPEGRPDWEHATTRTPRLVKCTPRRRCLRKPSTAPPVGTTMMVLQSGDTGSSVGTECSLLTYASTMSEGWDTSSFFADPPPVRAPSRPRSKKVSPRRVRRKKSISVQTEAVETTVDPHTVYVAVLGR